MFDRVQRVRGTECVLKPMALGPKKRDEADFVMIVRPQVWRAIRRPT